MVRYYIVDHTLEIGGTYGLGEIETSYKNLVRIFGNPKIIKDKGNKTDVEWGIVFADGNIATIYNWKNGKNYLDKDGISINDIDLWHVGGRVKKVLYYITDMLGAKIHDDY